jgi:flagellar motor switch protein FliN
MVQWLTEDLEHRLQTVFATLIPGARLFYAPGAAAPDPAGEPWVWWHQPLGVAPDATLIVGLPAAACDSIFAVVRQGGLLGVDPAGEAADAILRILANACATIAPGLCGIAGPLETPPQDTPLIFSLELAAGGQHKMAVLLSPSLIGAIEAEAHGELPDAGPVLLNLDLPVCISLGRARLEFRDLLRLSTGSVVELDRMLGDAVDVTINDSVIARGEIVVVEGNYGVRIQSVSGAACRSLAGLPGSR